MPFMAQYGIYKTVTAFSLGVSYVSANASLNVSLKVTLFHTPTPRPKTLSYPQILNRFELGFI